MEERGISGQMDLLTRMKLQYRHGQSSSYVLLLHYSSLTNTPSIQMHILICRPWAFPLALILLGDFRKPRSIPPSNVLCRIVSKKNDQEGVIVALSEYSKLRRVDEYLD